MAQTIRTAIYTRVSSAGQEDNYSLPTQETACRDFAAKRGWQVAAVYSDVHTRTELWERQQLTALRDAVRRRDVDAVVCYAIDRLSGDPVHLGVVLSEAEHHGAVVEFVTEPVDDSPEGQLIRFVRGYAAKVEHEKIKERTMRGRIARVESGKPNVGPRPPYGYTWADDRDKDGKPIKVRLIENPETAPVVRRIFRELVGGTSARQVGLRLSAEGIPTPTGKTHWTTATITLLAKHPVYTGNACAGRYRRERVKGHGKGWRYMRRDTSETLLLPGVAPALVSAELAGAAVTRLAANKQHSTRNNKHPEASLLRGYAICGYCGCQLRAVTPRAYGTLYRCNQANRDAHGCPSFSLQAHILDAVVWQGVRERLLNRDLIAAELARLERDDPTGDDLAAVERRATGVERRQRNLMARLADEDDADLAALIRADLAALLSERGRLDSERADLERQREGWRLAQARLSELDVWVRTVAKNLDDLDYAGKRLAIEACRVQVKVWARDRTPRWEATMRLGGDTPIALVDTTRRPLRAFCNSLSGWLWHNAGGRRLHGSGREEPERMELTILGGSAAGPNPGQGCSGYLVESGTTHVVVDLGPGTFPELRRHVDFRQIHGVVVSHGHLDHFLDIFALRYALAYNPVAADRPLPLWLPPGGLELLDRLTQAIVNDPDTEEFLSVFEVNQFNPDAVLTIGELQLRFHPTVHYVPCWAVRISNGVDGDLFYTADTGPAADLATAAIGSRVIIAEGTESGSSPEPYESRGHMTPVEAGALARDAGASVLVLSHLWFENDPFQAVREATQIFGGKVELATPGLRMSW